MDNDLARERRAFWDSMFRSAPPPSIGWPIQLQDHSIKARYADEALAERDKRFPPGEVVQADADELIPCPACGNQPEWNGLGFYYCEHVDTEFSRFGNIFTPGTGLSKSKARALWNSMRKA